jgi:hypothetical protein
MMLLIVLDTGRQLMLVESGDGGVLRTTIFQRCDIESETAWSTKNG